MELRRAPWFWLVVAILIVGVTYGVLTNGRSCVTECNGRCHTKCEPSLWRQWFG